jgi:hypothetical protein
MHRDFSYRTTADGRVRITWRGRTVATLNGRDAARFSARVTALDDDGAQRLMAKATGNFKRGNERKGDR